MERKIGVGLDLGTMYIVSAVLSNNEIMFKTQRDAFFNVENNPLSKGMLNKLSANYIESEDKKSLYVIGEEALQMANFFNAECRRPLAKGVVSTRETEALSMIKVILKSILGDPIEQNEICHFSVPAQPVDQDNYNVLYHENVAKSFITSFGYKAIPLNEALAIIWSELAEDNFSGMALSFGAGMCNIGLSFLGISEPSHQFSIARSGDWIDENSAKAVGQKASRMTIVKEAGVDLLNPQGREQEAIRIYYENLIAYVCSAIEKKLGLAENIPNFPNPITIIVSGGTSKILNFDKAFEKELKTKKLPFQIKEVRKATDPLNAVAKGCLLNSLNCYE